MQDVGAEDVVAAERPRVFVGLPVYGGYDPNFVECLVRFVKHEPEVAGYRVATMKGDSLVSRARNRLAKQFLESDATHLLFLDTDLIFSAEQIERLVSHDLPITAGLYPKKQDQLAWVCNTLPEYGDKDAATGLQRILYAGTGCLLIKREVFEAIAALFPEIRYDGDAGEPEGPYWDFFRVGVCAVENRRRYLSEDWYFCEMARQAGFKVFADTQVVLKHVGMAIYPRVNPFEGAGAVEAEGSDSGPMATEMEVVKVEPATPLEGFRFRDKDSEANAIEARACAASGRRGFFVISSNVPGAGKSALAARILGPITDTPAAELCASNAASWGRDMIRFAEQRYALFEDLSVRELKRRGDLIGQLATAASLSGWRLYSAKAETLQNRTLVIVTGNQVKLPPDLARRAKTIHLEGPEPYTVAKAAEKSVPTPPRKRRTVADRDVRRPAR